MNEERFIQNWISTYSRKNTKWTYSAGVKNFLDCIYGRGTDRSLEEYERLAARYISECRERRDYFKDLLVYAASLGDRPPKTAAVYVAAVKSFLEFSLDVELTKKQMRILRARLPKGNRARTVEDDLTREKLRKILTHCDAKGKALFLFLASSGVRIGEALKLRMEDVDLENDPPRVTVRGEYTKGGDTYFTFISKEAAEYLREWLKVRDRYLEVAKDRGKGLMKTGYGRGVKSVDDDRIFPFGKTVALSMWANAIKKANLEERDSSTNRRTLHIHMLRKFFQSQLKYAGVPEDIVEALIGHRGYLDDAYRRYTKKQIIEWYRKGEPYLLINVPREIREIQTRFQKEVEELRRHVEDLTRKLTDANAIILQQMSENVKLKERVSKLEEEMNAIRKLVREGLK